MSTMNEWRGKVGPAVLVVAIACALVACKKDEPATTAATNAAAETAAVAPTPESVVAASVSAMGADELRAAAAKSYEENRLYAPAGNNAMEYYLALRDKLPGDAGASSALSDLMPMAVIAAEQGIASEDFEEAKRLLALIGKADSAHPALERLKASVASKEQAVQKRAETERLTADEEAARQADLIKKREEDQRKLQEQQRQQAAQQAQLATQQAEQQRQAEEAQRQAAAAAEAERRRRAQQAEAQPAAPATPAASTPKPAAASNELHVVSQPSPRFPAAARRAGATGTVQVEFTVGTDGSVTNARIVSSDAPRQFQRDFEREAVTAVKRWRFQPIGQATTSRRTIAFQ